MHADPILLFLQTAPLSRLPMHRLRLLFQSTTSLHAGLSRSVGKSGLRASELIKTHVDLRRLATATSTAPVVAGQNEIKVKFLREGKIYDAYGKIGDTLLDVIINNELDFDGFGACEGTLACSTCHVILPKAEYDRIPNKPCDEELDMLDLAYDLTKTLSCSFFLCRSRLGCQIELSKDIDGMEVIIPATRYDARS